MGRPTRREEQGEPGLGWRESGVTFEPDAVLPAQWASIYSAYDVTGEQRLCLGVFAEALDTLRKYGKDPSPRGRALVTGVLDWVRGVNGPYPFSFDLVCGQTVTRRFGVEPEVVARAICRQAAEWAAMPRLGQMQSHRGRSLCHWRERRVAAVG